MDNLLTKLHPLFTTAKYCAITTLLHLLAAAWRVPAAAQPPALMQQALAAQRPHPRWSQASLPQVGLMCQVQRRLALALSQQEALMLRH